MTLLGNLLWFVCGGFLVAAIYFAAGLIMCLTIIGIPFGIQMWKLAAFALSPFGKDIVIKQNIGCLSIGFTIIWLICGWWETAFIHLMFMVLTGITIIGLPFAKAHWRLAKLSLAPFAWEIT